MPGWAKALIIVGVVIVLLVAGVVAGGIFWWSRNKDALIARGKAEIDQGRDFGRITDNQGCVDESISRYKKNPGFSGALATNLFMSSCLQNSRLTPGFCDDVPKQTEILKSGQWRAEQCNRVDLSTDGYCQQLFSPVQQFCERPQPKSGEDSESE